jgi:maleylacetoacetate isomerase
MAEARLFDYWRSTASWRVRIGLHLKGVAFTSQPVDLVAGDHRGAAHLARNPQGFVPVLEIDGLRLTQSLAILDYLDETRPAPPLMPEGAAARARVRAIAHAIAMDIHPVCNLSVAAHATKLAGGGAEVRQGWMQHFIRRGLLAVEALLDDPATGACCHGDDVTLADICLVPQLYNAARWEVETADLPRLTAIAAHLARHPAFAAAEAEAVRPVN